MGNYDRAVFSFGYTLIFWFFIDIGIGFFKRKVEILEGESWGFY